MPHLPTTPADSSPLMYDCRACGLVGQLVEVLVGPERRLTQCDGCGIRRQWYIVL